jgi:hypothetical protein
VFEPWKPDAMRVFRQDPDAPALVQHPVDLIDKTP